MSLPERRVLEAFDSLRPLPVLEGLKLREVGKAVILSSDPVEKSRLTLAAYHHFNVERLLEEGLGECYNVGEGEKPSINGINYIEKGYLPNSGKGGTIKSRAMMIQ